MTRAAATMPAVSERRTRGPSETATQPASPASAASSSARPPAGPMNSDTASGISCSPRRYERRPSERSPSQGSSRRPGAERTASANAAGASTAGAGARAHPPPPPPPAAAPPAPRPLGAAFALPLGAAADQRHEAGDAQLRPLLQHQLEALGPDQRLVQHQLQRRLRRRRPLAPDSRPRRP